MEAETPFSVDDLSIRRLSEYDCVHLPEFSCGVNELDNFFSVELPDCVKYRHLAVYGAYIPNSGELVALFTLMNDALMIDGQNERDDFISGLKFEADGDFVDFVARQTSYPGINIGHLGVSVQYQGMGIGSAIIRNVVGAYSEHTASGCQFVTVDALAASLPFYQRNLFNIQTLRDMYAPTRRMYRVINPSY